MSGGILSLDAAPEYVRSQSTKSRPLRNGDIITCTRTWKYETYIVEVDDLGEIVNETPDEEGEVVVRWKAQNKQGYIKPSALEHYVDPNKPGQIVQSQQSAPPPNIPPTQQAMPVSQLPPELMGGGGTSNARRLGVGYGGYTSAPAKGRAGKQSMAEIAREKQGNRHAAMMAQMSMEDDLPDLFPDDDAAPQGAVPAAYVPAHTSNPDTPSVQGASALETVPMNEPAQFQGGAGSPVASNPDAEDEAAPQTLKFQPGRIGIRYMGNTITKVTPGTQAEVLGVRFGWEILRVAENKLPTNMNNANCQKCVDTFLAQQKQEKQPYTITFRPTETVILVVGAGCEIVNGSYHEFGAHHGKPRYKQTNAAAGQEIYLWWDKHSYWNMVNQVDFIKYKQNGGSKKSCYYGIQSEKATPPTEGWMRSHLGKNPLPVLVAATGR